MAVAEAITSASVGSTRAERVKVVWRIMVLETVRRASKQVNCAEVRVVPWVGLATQSSKFTSPACRPDSRNTQTVHHMIRRILASQQAGLVLVIVLLGFVLSVFTGTHLDRATGQPVNDFLNSYTLIQTATDASFFAVMAVGATMVIISGGIDLSVGSVYALAGVAMAMVLRAVEPSGTAATVALGLAVSLSVGLICGAVNGLMVVGLRVHPFIITLGTMWILRGIAFVVSGAESILLPAALTRVAKASLGLAQSLYPLPMVVMLVVTVCG